MRGWISLVLASVHCISFALHMRAICKLCFAPFLQIAAACAAAHFVHCIAFCGIKKSNSVPGRHIV